MEDDDAVYNLYQTERTRDERRRCVNGQTCDAYPWRSKKGRNNNDMNISHGN